jgi:rubrerythrin
MTVSFTASEILEIAEQIERNGSKFYRDAATASTDKSFRRFFLQLAEIEDNHEKIFADMRKGLADETDEVKIFDPNDEMVYYLKAMAKSAGWEGKKSPDIEFSGREKPEQVIKKAIEAERASIDYYLGIKEFVASQANKDKVDAIIKEEMGHIVTLQKLFEQIK